MSVYKRKRKRIFEKSDVPVPGILAVPGSTAVHVDPNRKTFTFTLYNFLQLLQLRVQLEHVTVHNSTIDGSYN